MKKNLKKIPYFLFKPFYSYFNNQNFRNRMLQATYYESQKISEKIFLYESYHGKNATGNPYALFKKLQKDPRFKDFLHVWSLNDPNGKSAIDLKKNFKNVKIVKRESKEFVKYISKSKFLINNTSFPSYFQKKEGQIYINTWHGTPFKTIGTDIKNARLSNHGNIQRNLLHTDFIVSPNKFTYEKLLDSNKVDGIFSGDIIDVGYPRIDLTINSNPQETKKKLNLNQDKKIILYAPTWRDSDLLNIETAVESFYKHFKELSDEFSQDYQIILKVHYFIYEFFKELGLEDKCIPDWVDTNELLSCVDILITDYSSIFFDFLHTERPVIFFNYDKEKYEEERGLYLDWDELPGPICPNVNELIKVIQNISEETLLYKENYQKMKEKFCYNDNGNATERVIDSLFSSSPKIKPFKYKETQKKKVLIWGGGFTTNGITRSLNNLLSNIDYSKYDISLIFASKLNTATSNNIKKINPNVKIIYRTGTLNYKPWELYLHPIVMKFGLKNKFIEKLVPAKLYKRELKRVIGDVDYDIAIDFCGYTSFWTMLFAHNNFNKKSIYLHSDMIDDSLRTVNGKFKHLSLSKVTFHLYKKFDKLICVSEDALLSNKEKLFTYIGEKEIVTVENSINSEEIIKESISGEYFNFENEKYLINNLKNKDNTLNLQGILSPNQNDINFVTVGRLSPEKDHEKLIKAFSKLNEKHENTRLYIVGEGPLRNNLTNLIKTLNLGNKVILTGEMHSPFALLNECDCFVMSSNYEGQGLSILEALILKKPVISTDIPGPRGLLKNGIGELTPNTEDDLANSMMNFVNKKPSYPNFNYQKYNDDAMKSFYKEVFFENIEND